MRGLVDLKIRQDIVWRCGCQGKVNDSGNIDQSENGPCVKTGLTVPSQTTLEAGNGA